MSQLLSALAVMGACVVVHLVGGFALLMRIDRKLAAGHEHSLAYGSLVMFQVFAVVVLLHTGEVAMWAALYTLQLDWDFGTSMYFSMVTYATIGYGDVVPPEGWRFGAAVEGMSGVLMLGWSSAIVFAVVNRLFSAHRERTASRAAT